MAATTTLAALGPHPIPPPPFGRERGYDLMPKLTPKQVQVFVVIAAAVVAPMIAMLAVTLVVVLVDLMAGG